LPEVETGKTAEVPLVVNRREQAGSPIHFVLLVQNAQLIGSVQGDALAHFHSCCKPNPQPSSGVFISGVAKPGGKRFLLAGVEVNATLHNTQDAS
jgi:hypothetical protein